MPAAVLAAALVVSGCGGDSSPTTIDPTPPVGPTFTLAQATERLTAAKAAAGDMGRKLDNMSTQAMIDDARMKVNAAWEARMQLSETDRGALQTLRDNFMAAQETRARYLYGKVRGAITDINDYDPTTITAARKALTDAEDAYEKAGLTGDFANLTSEINARQTQGVKKNGEAMYAALSGHKEDTTSYRDARNSLARDADYKFPLSDSSKPTGLWLDPHDEGPGSLPKEGVNVSPIVFTKVKTRGQVGRWKVTDETGAVDEDGFRDADLAKFHDRARVYNTRAVRTVPAPTHFDNDYGDRPAHAGTYTAGTRTLSLGTGVDGSIASPMFPTSGHKDFKPEGDGKEVLVKGTYVGAPGTYHCTWSAIGDCRVSVGRGGFFMAANWEFVHEKDAKVSFLNHDFAYFGWWVRENAGDRMPRMATVFIGVEGGGIDPATDGNSNTIHGTATFEGPAVGVYAIHDPLNGKGEAGEFTAKARLDARFGTTDNVPQTGMSGTINQFRLNGGSVDPEWTVTLEKNAWADGGKIDDRTDSTVWSINGIKGAKVGKWGGRMYDTTVEDSVGGDDGNNQPDVVLGTFYTEHGGTHRMVGAFGAHNIAKYDE